MKNYLLVICSILISAYSFSQEWVQDLPQDKLENGSLTFYEIQDAFYNYWESYNVENGYYIVDGEKLKAPYYKLFKRWEWYWEPRINPETGVFPDMQTLDDYYKSMAGSRSIGGTWVSEGPSTSSGGYAGLGRLNCVSFTPGSTSEYYAGACSGGIWHTADDGATWTVLNDSVPVLGVSDILVINAATGPNTLYIATGDRDGGSVWSLGGQQSNDNNSVGVLKSIDGGATWTTTGLSFTASQKIRVNRLLMDPNSAYQIIYAATSNGVYKSTDGGINWPLVSTNSFIDMEFKPGDPTTLYGSTEGTPAKIYKSTNSGVSWTQIASYSSGNRAELAVSYNQPTWVYALVSANSSGGGGLLGIYQSTNSGASYSQVFNGSTSGNNLLGWSCNGTGSGGQGTYDLCIAADPNNASTIYIGGVNTWKSTDGGSTFSIVNHWTGCSSPSAQNVHADKHFLVFQHASSTLFEANDGGLYKTADGGVNWTHLSSGMAISQFYRLGVGQSGPNEIIGGLQDNGTKALLSGTWSDVIGGDGFECIIDYTDKNTQYGALYYGDIYKTTNYWGSSNQISGSIPGSGAWCTPYIIDPLNNSTLYVGYDEVFKSTNQGSSWSQISNQGGNKLRSMAISNSNTNYIYAADLGDIFRTTNGGGPTQSWSNVSSNLPTGTNNITYVTVKADDPDFVWVSMGGYDANGVYETTNGGGSWNNISAGLPQLPVMCVVQNHQYTGIELYAATDVGVYVKRDGANWVAFNDGLPNVLVTELEIYYDAVDPDDNKIYAASFGRGIWSSDLYNPNVAPVASFMGTPTSGLPPLTVNFTDLSTNTITSWDWEFGDGNISTQQNPINVYNIPGTYDVSLKVTGPGGSDSLTILEYIDVLYFPPTADFIADVTSGEATLTVNFTDLSLDSVNTWRWDFGTGDTSDLQHPTYNYTTPGIYTVSLTASGPGGSNTMTKTDYITVHYPIPTADFMGDPTGGDAPLDVQFTDLSADSVNSWEWDFGDGNTSTLQNPSNQYTLGGSYTVSLTVMGPGGDGTEVKTNYIIVGFLPPNAEFSGNPTSGFFPLMVNFTDLSSGMVNNWKWYFGDGNTSVSQHPEHTYQNSGQYTVSLKSTGPGGTDSIAKINFITVMVGIEELNTDELNIYPNPCHEYLTISSKLSVRSITMADIIGNIVKDERITCPTPCEHRINMTEFHSGIYFCKIVMENGKMVLMKVLKE